MQYNYQTHQLLDKGVNFATIYPEKQGVVKEMTGFDFDLVNIVSFLKKETDNFTILLPLALEIDKNIVSIYNKYQVSQGKKAEEPKAEPKPEPTPEPPKDERPSVAILTGRLKLIKKMYAKNPSVVLKGRIKIIEKMLTQPEKFCCGGKMSGGGKTSYDKIRPGVSFTIADMKEYLNGRFNDSFGFEVWPLKKGTRNAPEMDLFNGKKIAYKGLTDSDVGSKLHFPQYKRTHEINYQINQGSENTYFYFLLEDEKSDGFVGHFGFKDGGDVGPEWITGFLVFLQEQYGLPFKTEHNVYSGGGYVGKTPEQVWKEWDGGQRLHFLIDHTGKQHTPTTQNELTKKAYNFLPTSLKEKLGTHVSWGQYAGGGELKSELKRLNDELALTERGTPERMEILGKINMLKHNNPELRRFAGGGGMNPQKGQINDLKKYVSNLNEDKVKIIAEAGNDNGETFRGRFLADVNGKKYSIEDGKLTKRFADGGGFGDWKEGDSVSGSLVSSDYKKSGKVIHVLSDGVVVSFPNGDEIKFDYDELEGMKVI